MIKARITKILPAQFILLTNISRIPLITERIQRVKEMMQVITMRQSNNIVRYICLAAVETEHVKRFSLSGILNMGLKTCKQSSVCSKTNSANLQAPVTFQSLHSLMSTSLSRSTFILPL